VSPILKFWRHDMTIVVENLKKTLSHVNQL